MSLVDRLAVVGLVTFLLLPVATFYLVLFTPETWQREPVVWVWRRFRVWCATTRRADTDG